MSGQRDEYGNPTRRPADEEEQSGFGAGAGGGGHDPSTGYRAGPGGYGYGYGATGYNVSQGGGLRNPPEERGFVWSTEGGQQQQQRPGQQTQPGYGSGQTGYGSGQTRFRGQEGGRKD